MKFFKKIKLFLETTVSAFYFIFLRQIEIKNFVVVEGEIVEREIQIDEENQIVKVSAKAKMQAVNRANGLVELINPKYFKQSENKSFATTKSDCRRNSDLYSTTYADDVLPNYDLINLELRFKGGNKP